MILIDINRGLTHLGAFLILVHETITKWLVLLSLSIKLRLLLIWRLVTISKIILGCCLIIVGWWTKICSLIVLSLGGRLNLVVLGVPRILLLVLRWLVLRPSVWCFSYWLDTSDLTFLAILLTRSSLSRSCWVLHLIITKRIVSGLRSLLSLFGSWWKWYIPWGKMIVIWVRVVVVCSAILALSSIRSAHLLHAHWHIFRHCLSHCLWLNSIPCGKELLIIVHFLQLLWHRSIGIKVLIDGLDFLNVLHDLVKVLIRKLLILVQKSCLLYISQNKRRDLL